MQIDKNNLYELEILKQVEQSSKLNNRMAAVKLGCSVKLAHVILKRMVTKGLLNVNKLNSRNWEYFLTPTGISEKAKLTYEFLQFSMTFYHEARKKSSQVFKDLADVGKTKIGFIGVGELAEIAFLGIKEWNLELVEVYNSISGSKFFGIPVLNYNDIMETKADALVVCLYSKIHPMSEKYLPDEINNHISNDINLDLRWIF